MGEHALKEANKLLRILFFLFFFMYPYVSLNILRSAKS